MNILEEELLRHQQQHAENVDVKIIMLLQEKIELENVDVKPTIPIVPTTATTITTIYKPRTLFNQHRNTVRLTVIRNIFHHLKSNLSRSNICMAIYT